MFYTKEMEENLRHGILEMLILKMLSYGDMNICRMTNEMNVRGQGLLKVKEGLLYGPIYQMVGKKYISETRTLEGKHQGRSSYHLEPVGLEYLHAMEHIYANITKGVDFIMSDATAGENHTSEDEKDK